MEQITQLYEDMADLADTIQFIRKDLLDAPKGFYGPEEITDMEVLVAHFERDLIDLEERLCWLEKEQLLS